MPTRPPSPERNVCFEVAGHIACEAIRNGHLSDETEAVTKYIEELYPKLVRLRLNDKV